MRLPGAATGEPERRPVTVEDGPKPSAVELIGSGEEGGLPLLMLRVSVWRF